MAFGGNAGGRASGGDLDEAVDAMEQAAASLGRIRHRLDAAGAPLAATYVEGACDALSFATEAALWVAVHAGGAEGDAWLGALRIRLEREGEGAFAGLATQVAVRPPATAGRALGAEMAGAAAILDVMRDDEVACGLMAAALAHSDWIHLESGEVFQGDALASRAVVAAVVGRTSFPAWTRRQMGGMIHRGSADALAALGWRRLTGAALPAT